MVHTLFYRFGVALFIGILVGLQRKAVADDVADRQREMFAGVRTFALLSLAGCPAFCSFWQRVRCWRLLFELNGRIPHNQLFISL
jgi:hypothetical protein